MEGESLRRFLIGIEVAKCSQNKYNQERQKIGLILIRKII